MKNIEFLTEILRSEPEYWVAERVQTSNTILNKGKRCIDIVFISIPYGIKRFQKKEDIKLIDLEKLNSSDVSNVFLSKDIAPFQVYIKLSEFSRGFAIPCNQKQILKDMLEIQSDDIFEYKKVIDKHIT